MKRLLLITLPFLMLSSCAPVLNRDFMSSGIYNIPPSLIIEDQARFSGELFILGGVIVDTKVTVDGSLVEAIFVPVNSLGYLKDTGVSDGRFLALYPKEKGLLDPLIFLKEREITVAGEFKGTRSGRIDEMEYTYPLFEIKDIYLWEERMDYYIAPPFYPLWDYPGMYYGPWWRYY
jgi:outer membrane lipoprotein